MTPSTPPPKPQHRETIVISTLLATYLAHVLDFVIMMPLGPKLIREFQISAAVYGTIVASYTIAAACSSFLSMAWLDRLDRKTALLILVAGFAAANILCAWSPTAAWLIGGRVLAGLFGGVMSTVIYAIVGEIIPVARRGNAAGILGTAFPIVSIVGVPVILKIADYYGWRCTFIAVMALSLISLLAAQLCLPRIPPPASAASNLAKRLQAVLAEPAHRWGILLVVLAVLGGFTIVPYIAPFLVGNGYIHEEQLYLVYLVGGICSILSSRIIGRLSDRYLKTQVLRVVLVFTAISILLFTNLPPGSLVMVLFMSALTMVFLPGRFVCIMALLTMLSHPQQRGAFMGLVATCQSLTIGVASLLGGQLVGETADGSLATYWLAGLAAAGANLVIFLVIPKWQYYERQAIARHTQAG